MAPQHYDVPAAGQAQCILQSVQNITVSRLAERLLVYIKQTQQSYHGYFNFTYQPVYKGPQRVTGILAFAVVTKQVRAHQQVEQLNQYQ